jgi:hypothetical protein
MKAQPSQKHHSHPKSHTRTKQHETKNQNAHVSKEEGIQKKLKKRRKKELLPLYDWYVLYFVD